MLNTPLQWTLGITNTQEHNKEKTRLSNTTSRKPLSTITFFFPQKLEPKVPPVCIKRVFTLGWLVVGCLEKQENRKSQTPSHSSPPTSEPFHEMICIKTFLTIYIYSSAPWSKLLDTLYCLPLKHVFLKLFFLTTISDTPIHCPLNHSVHCFGFNVGFWPVRRRSVVDPLGTAPGLIP